MCGGYNFDAAVLMVRFLPPIYGDFKGRSLLSLKTTVLWTEDEKHWSTWFLDNPTIGRLALEDAHNLSKYKL